MVAREPGVVIYVASELGFLGRERYAPYCAASAIGLTKSLARELAPQIRATDRAGAGQHAHAVAGDHERGMAREGARRSRRRLGEPDETADRPLRLRPRAVLLWPDAQSQWRRLGWHESNRFRSAPAVAALLAERPVPGLTLLPLKYFAIHGLGGVALTLVAHGGVGLLGLPLIWLQRAPWRPQAPLLLLICLLGGTANLCFVNALMHGEAVRAMLLFYLAPMWSVLGGTLFWG